MIPAITSAPSAAPGPGGVAAPRGPGTGAFGRLVSGDPAPQHPAVGAAAAKDPQGDAARPAEAAPDAPAEATAAADGTAGEAIAAKRTDSESARGAETDPKDATAADDAETLLGTVRDIESRNAARGDPDAMPPAADPGAETATEAARTPSGSARPADPEAEIAGAAPAARLSETGPAQPDAAAPRSPAAYPALAAPAEPHARGAAAPDRAESAPRTIPLDGPAGPRRSEPPTTPSEAAVIRLSPAPAHDAARDEARPAAPDAETPRPGPREAPPPPAGTALPDPRATAALAPAPGPAADSLPGGAAPQAPAEAARTDLAPGAAPGATDPAPRPAAAPPAPAFAPAAPARQVMEAIVTAQNDRFEIALSPEELGRVRITISHAEHGLTVHLAAEREDTMGLLRRHAAELTRALAEMGLGSADIAFGDGRGNGDAEKRGTGRAVRHPIRVEGEAALLPDPPRPALPGRMDLRL